MSRNRNPLLIAAASTAFAALACLLTYSPASAYKEAFNAKASVKAQGRALRLRRSPLMKMINDRLKQQPRMSDEELAAYANSLLAREGYDYDFDVCEFLRTIPKRGSRQGQGPYQFQMTQTDGRKITLRADEDVMTDGMCGECFMAFSSLRVTRSEVLLLLGGRQYHLKRPRGFGLDEMSLVDESMKKVIRTWEVPEQSMPFGISADGTRLYVGTEVERLALEISTTSISFKPSRRVDVWGGEVPTNITKTPENDYLGYMRFSYGGKSYIVRYSSPCT